MLHSLSALALGRLGLSPDGAGQRDPAQARLAIEAIKALVGVLEQVRPAGEIAAHRGMVAQLQLAFAGAVTAAAPHAEPAEGQAPAESEASQTADAETPRKAAEAANCGIGGGEPRDDAEAPDGAGRPQARQTASRQSSRLVIRFSSCRPGSMPTDM